ncbi:MAG TPA: helix-turn-helix domain-containing protein [Caulobacteraceae bacterium]|jgi:transcriptional regulator with XRE-family HTH domain|nr:helix-turn-helix domain-containing protein [Caulobacteraceae bacterium]
MLEDQVRRIREALGAANDSELAEKLGLGRSAVSRWKERGVIPAKFRFLAERDGRHAIEHGSQFIEHDRLYGHADHHYWLRAALQFIPPGYGAKLAAPDRARLLEFVLTRLMGAAADATVRELGKRRCESEEDLQALLEVLGSGTSSETGSMYADRIARVLAEGLPANPT